MNASIGLGSGISDEAEFNRRVVIAMRGIHFGAPQLEKFPREMQSKIEAGQQLTDAEHQKLLNLIYKFRRQVSDQSLVSYCVLRAKGAD